MKKSRKYFLKPEANQGKLCALQKVYTAYLEYLQICVNYMIENHRFSIDMKERKDFFPVSENLAVSFMQAVFRHAVTLVSKWAKSNYTNKIKKLIKYKCRSREISSEEAHYFYTIGKYSWQHPKGDITQERINVYWNLLLSECKPPKVKETTGMWLHSNTGVFRSGMNKVSDFWVGVSVLNKGRRVNLPLTSNPYIKSKDLLDKSFYLKKDKRGRWVIQTTEQKEYPEPSVSENAPSIGLDVGRNVLVATSDGGLYGQSIKPKFECRYKKLQQHRANRRRQGLFKDSPRLQRQEERLSGFLKTECGRIANILNNKYSEHLFVMEDLDLSGVKGCNRWLYKGMHYALQGKVAIKLVNSAYTSQECPSCGYTSDKNRRGTKFRCCGCGKFAHADIIGSINILRRSQDEEVDVETEVCHVKNILDARYKLRRCSGNSSLECKNELLGFNQKLTTEVWDTPQLGTVSKSWKER